MRVSNLERVIVPVILLINETFSFSYVGVRRKISAESVTRVRSRPSVRAPEGFVAPQPKPLAIPEGEGQIGSLFSGTVALALRLATGAFVLGWKIDSLSYQNNGDYSLKLGPISLRDSSSILPDAPRPKVPLVLYEYESSPYCRIVRETMNLLDINYECRPCPGARRGFSDELAGLTEGRRTVPYLIDPNAGRAMFESSDQIEYLLDMYGPPPGSYDGLALWPIRFQQFAFFTSAFAALARGMPASQPDKLARPDNTEMLPLKLWGYECSPFVRPVRERMCELCLPHIIVSCSRGSANRDAMVKKTGRFQVPYLEDPNTGIEMFESNEICKYLDTVYTTKENL
mmetsp:Transcript_5132/g.10831  ORF Transcript_5132/g.10831 Transcript_5132/m.10831 type:complete len:343 (+) Transcript_5132:83-1111(+)